MVAISYPGQDGARGDGDFENVQGLIQQALSRINQLYSIKDAIFVGRSLGSMVAVIAANKWHPRGLVLEGTSSALSDGIYSFMKSKWFLQPAILLPVKEIIKKDYSLSEGLTKLPNTKIAIFQGGQ